MMLSVFRDPIGAKCVCSRDLRELVMEAPLPDTLAKPPIMNHGKVMTQPRDFRP
jgi:hypothetical protein